LSLKRLQRWLSPNADSSPSTPVAIAKAQISETVKEIVSSDSG
jgi:hypothetical protein